VPRRAAFSRNHGASYRVEAGSPVREGVRHSSCGRGARRTSHGRANDQRTRRRRTTDRRATGGIRRPGGPGVAAGPGHGRRAAARPVPRPAPAHPGRLRELPEARPPRPGRGAALRPRRPGPGAAAGPGQLATGPGRRPAAGGGRPAGPGRGHGAVATARRPEPLRRHGDRRPGPTVRPRRARGGHAAAPVRRRPRRSRKARRCPAFAARWHRGGPVPTARAAKAGHTQDFPEPAHVPTPANAS
jgi:hypothetical protein